MSKKDSNQPDERHAKLETLIQKANITSITNVIDDYNKKYIKYKNKYLSLKRKLTLGY